MNETVSTCNILQYTPQGNTPPHDYHGSNYCQKLNVWCDFCGDVVILGPSFFESNVDMSSNLESIDMEILPFQQYCFQSNARQFQ